MSVNRLEFPNSLTLVQAKGAINVSRYFKLVSLCDEPQWYITEFLSGRARYGWSWQGMDLRTIRGKDCSTWSEQERISWKYTKFLLERIEVGDRIVVQLEQPLTRFLIGQVIAPYDFSPGDLPDFNHVLPVKVLSPEPISINLREVTAALKHNLSKRGQYYEIYPEGAIQDLNEIVERIALEKFDVHSIRSDGDTLDQTLHDIKKRMVREISQKWPAKSFEPFCATLCNSVDFIEVKEERDTHRGWDLLIQIFNPLTGALLHDDVPVQCKYFDGLVSSIGPIDDLERSIRNSKSHSQVAYLFILGKLSDEFNMALAQREALLTEELGHPVKFEVLDEDRIAELYMSYVVHNLSETDIGE